MADVDPVPIHPSQNNSTWIKRAWWPLSIATVVIFGVVGIPLLILASSPPSEASAHAILIVRSTDGSNVSVGLPWLSGRPGDLNFSVVSGRNDPWFREHAAAWFLESVLDDFGPGLENRSFVGQAAVQGNLLKLETNGTIAVVFEWTWRGPKDTIPFGRLREFEPSLPLDIGGPPDHVEIAFAGVEFSLEAFVGLHGQGAFAITDTDGNVPNGYIPISGLGRAFDGVVEAVPPYAGSFISLRWGSFSTAVD